MSTNRPQDETIFLADRASLFDISRTSGAMRKEWGAIAVYPSDGLLPQNATGCFSRCPQTPSLTKFFT
jgi:hypothetical protein